jgi:hypothetical protein
MGTKIGWVLMKKDVANNPNIKPPNKIIHKVGRVCSATLLEADKLSFISVVVPILSARGVVISGTI